jgi:hypothetical protein
MKYSLLLFLVIISASAGTKSVYAEQENLFPARIEPYQPAVMVPTIDDPNQAANLLTEAATIDSKWQNVIIQPANNLNPANSKFTLMQEQGCKKMNPLDFLEDMAAAFEKCRQLNNNQTPPPRSSEPIEYFKVPKLDSGLSVTVTQF